MCGDFDTNPATPPTCQSLNAARQLRTNVAWVNCEARPDACAGQVRYDHLPATQGFHVSRAGARTPV